MLVSGAENGVAHCLPALAVTCLPLCLLRWERGLVCIRLALLWYSLNPLFCEKARLCLRLEPFVGKFFFFFFFFFFSSWLSHSLGCYRRLAPSDCPQVIQPGPYPKHASRASLSSPRLPVQPPLTSGQHEHLGYFSAGSCSSVPILCVCVCVFPCWLCCPLRFQSSLQTCQ